MVRMRNLRLVVAAVIAVWCVAHRMDAQQPFHPHHRLFVQMRRIADVWNNPDPQKVSHLLNKVDEALAQSPEDGSLRLLRIYLLQQKRDYSSVVQAIESLNPDTLDPESRAIYFRHKCHSYWKTGRYLDSLSIVISSLLKTFAQQIAPMVLLISAVVIVYLYALLHLKKEPNSAFVMRFIITIFIIFMLIPLIAFLSGLLVAGAPMPAHKGDRARAALVSWTIVMLLLLGAGIWLSQAQPEQRFKESASALLWFGLIGAGIGLIYAIHRMQWLNISLLQLSLSHSTVLFWLWGVLSVGFATMVYGFFVLRALYSGFALTLSSNIASVLALLCGVLVWWSVEELFPDQLPFTILAVGASIGLYRGGVPWYVASVPIGLTRLYFLLNQFVINFGQL